MRRVWIHGTRSPSQRSATRPVDAKVRFREGIGAERTIFALSRFAAAGSYEETSMKLSTERILTTHVGSLPRPRLLLELILAKEESRLVDAAVFETRSEDAVAEVVAQQVSAGVDIVSDGEMSKPSYATYVKHRVDGIGMDAAAAEQGRQVMLSLDRLDHPDFVTPTGFANVPLPACLGPLRYADRGPLERDIAHLSAAVEKAKPVEAFMTAPSPGILTRFVVDTYYRNED